MRAWPPVIELFASAHLRTRAERSVYSTIARGPTRSARTRAVAAGIGHHDPDMALRQFAAGISACTDGAVGPHRYRWILDIDRIGATMCPAVVDAVSGMPFLEDTPHLAGVRDLEERLSSLPRRVRCDLARGTSLGQPWPHSPRRRS